MSINCRFALDEKRYVIDLIGPGLWAVFCIVQEFTKFVRSDLWKEHRDAEDFDYILGIGVPEGSSGEYKAWSQNLVHENVLTTFSSYGDVGSCRQAEIHSWFHAI